MIQPRSSVTGRFMSAPHPPEPVVAYVRPVRPVLVITKGRPRYLLVAGLVAALPLYAVTLMAAAVGLRALAGLALP